MSATQVDQNAWSGVNCFNCVGDHIRFLYDGVEFSGKIIEDEDGNLEHLIRMASDGPTNRDKTEAAARLTAFTNDEWSYVSVRVERVDNPSIAAITTGVESDAPNAAFENLAKELARGLLPENQPKWGSPTIIGTVSTLGCVMACLTGNMNYREIRSAPGGEQWLRQAGISDEVTLTALRKAVKEIRSEHWMKRRSGKGR